eukprot:sb/3471841/
MSGKQKNGQDFVSYAVKIGYSKDLAETAVRRLGHNASTNSLLHCVQVLFMERKKRIDDYHNRKARVGPRFTGTPNYREDKLPIGNKWCLTSIYRVPCLPGKTLSPEHPGKSGSDCIVSISVILAVGPRFTGTPNYREDKLPIGNKWCLTSIYRVPCLPGKTLSPEHPGKSGSDCIV